MKFLASLFISAVLMFSSSSCNKCYECDFSTNKATPDIQELCRKDFPGDKNMFEATIEGYESAGYTCNAK